MAPAANDVNGVPCERAGYFAVAGAHLYTVLHEMHNPVARVLLVGHFASERHLAYQPWVQWARFLADKGVEVLRYDYRGVGESTGVFEEMSFENWRDDVSSLATWLRQRGEGTPLILHGLGVGGLLAAHAFTNGFGDALLLWSPTRSANRALRSMLVRWVNVEQLFKYGEDRKPASAFIRDLESDVAVEVEGYQWSGALWRESFSINLPAALSEGEAFFTKDKRPVRSVKLGREASPLIKAGTVADDRAKDFTWLFAENWNWLAGTLAFKGTIDGMLCSRT